MYPEIEILLKQVLTETDETAILTLMYIMERSTRMMPDDSFYKEQLSPQHLRIKLSYDDQHEIVQKLLANVTEVEHGAEWVWICSKARPLILAEFIPGLLLTHHTVLYENNALYQGMIAFQNALSISEDYPDTLKIMTHINYFYDDLIALFENLTLFPEQNISEQAQVSIDILKWQVSQ